MVACLMASLLLTSKLLNGEYMDIILAPHSFITLGVLILWNG